MTRTLPQQSQREPRVGWHTQQLIRNILLYIVLIAIALIILIPLAWMVSTSIKPKAEWFLPEIRWIPMRFTLENYDKILNNTTLPIGRWFINSVLVSSITTVAVLTVDSLAAYAYARMEFRGKNALFSILLATLFLPGMMFLIPNFLTVTQLGLL